MNEVINFLQLFGINININSLSRSAGRKNKFLIFLNLAVKKNF
jgi:hypothetical protein